MSVPKLVTSEAVFKAMAATGAFDFADGNTVRRVVIDLRAGSLPVVHVELHGDERLLDVVPSLVGVQVKKGDVFQ
jgi:hypothetical protein